MGKSKIDWCDETEQRLLELRRRFWGYVACHEGQDACWLWQGGCFTNGYGQFRVGAQKLRAHRFAWKLFYGAIPKGMLVCHRCDKKGCVRPDHLFLGTQKDNIADMDAKGRRVVSRAPRPSMQGEGNAAAKLTAGSVQMIRSFHAGGVSYRQLAKTFRISCSQVANIVCGRNWRQTNA